MHPKICFALRVFLIFGSFSLTSFQTLSFYFLIITGFIFSIRFYGHKISYYRFSSLSSVSGLQVQMPLVQKHGFQRNAAEASSDPPRYQVKIIGGRRVVVWQNGWASTGRGMWQDERVGVTGRVMSCLGTSVDGYCSGVLVLQNGWVIVTGQVSWHDRMC